MSGSVEVNVSGELGTPKPNIPSFHPEGSTEDPSNLQRMREDCCRYRWNLDQYDSHNDAKNWLKSVVRGENPKEIFCLDYNGEIRWIIEVPFSVYTIREKIEIFYWLRGEKFPLWMITNNSDIAKAIRGHNEGEILPVKGEPRLVAKVTPNTT